MNTTQKIDTLLASLHTIAAAPNAADTGQFQQSIQKALVDVPAPSKPSGDQADPDQPAAARTDTYDDRVMLANRHSDPYGFRPPGGLGENFAGLGMGLGGEGGRRDIDDIPQFADEVGGPPQICSAISRSAQDSPNQSWTTNITLAEGNLVACVQYFVSTVDCRPEGTYTWL